MSDDKVIITGDQFFDLMCAKDELLQNQINYIKFVMILCVALCVLSSVLSIFCFIMANKYL